MPVNLFMPSNIEFFKPLGPEIVALAEQLEGLGHTFKLEFWAVKVYKGDTLEASITTPVTTSNVLKKTATDEQIKLLSDALKKIFVDIIKKAGAVPAPPKATPAAPPLKTTMAVDVAKEHGMEHNQKFKDAVSKHIQQKGKPPTMEEVQAIKNALFGPAKTPTGFAPGVIKLETATALGQKVAGTSPGSVYHVIALNPRVKLAARLLDGELSLRAEGPLMTGAEKQGLAQLGMTFSAGGNYYSTHFKLGDVPLARVLGAVLYGCSIAFTLQIKGAQELPHDA